MKLAALVSGGKDSLYAAYLASKEHKIEYIISVVSENPESYMFHYPNIHLVKEQAKLMNIEFIEKKTKGEKEKELEDLEDALRAIKNNIDGVVTGAVASNYQKMRIDSICKSLGLLSFAPLWHVPAEQYINDAILDGFEMIIVGVAAPPLDQDWLGRQINGDVIRELQKLNKKHGIHVGGEGGETESLVLDCPMFSKRIEIVDSEKIWDSKTRSGYLDIKEIELIDKN